MEALCGSIFMTQKFNKSVRKMRVSLEEVEESRRVQMTKKVEEKRELMAGLTIFLYSCLSFTFRIEIWSY